jgi:Fe-S-cluster containining protein
MTSLALPPLYRRWVDEFLKQDIYSEPSATCDDCAMCKYVDPPASQDKYFKPTVKCCSYYPTMPNYLIGAIITDDDPSLNEVKEQFLERIMKFLITPLGTVAPYMINLYNVFEPFGQYENLLCPFFLNHSGGLCGIWKYRNSVCSTYFCKHERGQVGWLFWRRLALVLISAEKHLAKYCADQFPVVIPENPSDIREQTWGNWTFREGEFFQNCWNVVRELHWDDVVKIAGTELETRVNDFKNQFRAVQSKTLPEVLKMNHMFRYEEVAQGLSRVWGYSKYNPIDLPTNIVRALECFDGRPNSEVLNQIKSEREVMIENDLLQKLLDYEILLPVK